MQVIQSRVGKLADPEEQAAQNDLHERLRKAIASLDEVLGFQFSCTISNTRVCPRLPAF